MAPAVHGRSPGAPSPGPASLGSAVWRQRRVALAALVVVLAAVGWWLHSAPRSYSATATITAAPVPSLLQSTGNFENLEATLAQIANSQSVLEDVSSRLNGKRTVAQLRKEVHGTQVRGTVLIRVTVIDSDADAASSIANEVAAVLPRHDPSRGLFVFTQTDPARVPASYSAPNTKVIALAGLALGLLLAIGAALLYDNLAGMVQTAAQLRASTGTEVLGVLPRPRRRSTLPAAQTGTPSSEAFRSLRVALMLASRGERLDGIVVASASAKRDVSAWLAINLAVALANVHHRVLLIDGVCGKRDTHPVLLDRGSAGLYGVLREEAKVDDALLEGPIGGVTVLPAGCAAPDSTFGLIESRFKKLLAEVDDRFDAVIVVAAPASDSEDTKAMAVGGSLVLAVAGRTMRGGALRGVMNELESAQVPVLGTVLIESRRRLRG
jgi:polysaccharide biosynthesis transport protein